MKPATGRTIWLLYAAFIVYGGTIPFHFSGGADLLVERLHRLPLNPFISPETGRRLSIPDIVQNILFFLPFGVLGVAAARNAAGWTWRRIGWVTLLGAGLSCLVEGVQLMMRNRVASTADLMTNTLGAFAGGAGARWCSQLAAAVVARLRREGLADVQEIRPLAVATGALAIAFLQPFDVTLEVGTVAGHIRAFASNPWQLTVLRDEGIVLLIASLFAMALASYVSALGETHPATKSAALGIGLVGGLEASQIVIGSRMPGLWDFAIGSAGILIGAALWQLSSRIVWPGLWRGLLILMTVFGVTLQMLSPFELAAEYRGFSWFPFLGYYTRTTFETLSHVIELALAYFPLGFCLVLNAKAEGRAMLGALMVALAICAPVEYLQGWIVGRFPDVSDVGLSLAGAWIGCRLARSVS